MRGLIQNMTGVRVLFFSLLTCLVFSSISGCTSSPLIEPVDFTSDLVFFESWTHISARTLSGPGLPGLYIDFPTYSFRRESRELFSYRDLFGTEPLEIDPSVVNLVTGSGMSLGGDMGGGAMSDLAAPDALPVRNGEVTILRLSETGNVTIAAIPSFTVLEYTFRSPLPAGDITIEPGREVRYSRQEIQRVHGSRVSFTVEVRLRCYAIPRVNCRNGFL